MAINKTAKIASSQYFLVSSLPSLTVNKISKMDYKLQYTSATDGDNAADYIQFINAAGVNKPTLTVTYTLP